MAKPLIVLDSMALIHLAKVSVLEGICLQFEVVIPQAVFGEAISEGLGKHADAALSNQLVKEGKIKVVPAKNVEKFGDYGLGGGEAECISVALEYSKRGITCIMVSNDLVAEDAAKILGINWVFVPLFIAVLSRKKKLQKEKAKTAITSLENAGWYSHTVIENALEALENV